jgi:G:T/U-mismatch repair DNA glycosylase
MITTHKYLDNYPIDPASEKLIVGTIHPHDHAAFQVPFFYGNKSSLWTILHKAFPSELPDPHRLADILAFLDRRKIAISDMIWECRRKSHSALDQDLIPIRLNEELPDQIRYSNIREVLFTSGFGKNNAFKLFYVDLLKRRLTKQIRRDREVTLENELLGHPVRLRVIYSPSGAANTGLVKSALYLANRAQYEGHKTPVQAFKIDYYREVFED